MDDDEQHDTNEKCNAGGDERHKRAHLSAGRRRGLGHGGRSRAAGAAFVQLTIRAWCRWVHTGTRAALLTPVAAIRQRLAAAAQGDFVTAFYNPQSKRRRTLLPEAREVFLTQRPPTTPVALCRQLGRPEESVTVTTLQDFDPSVVDMFTLVVIGSSTTRAFDHAGTPRAFTPRGYADKRL